MPIFTSFLVSQRKINKKEETSELRTCASIMRLKPHLASTISRRGTISSREEGSLEDKNCD